MQDGTEMINKYRICPACKRFTLAERCFCEYCGQNISNDPLIQYVKKENPSINESLDAIPKIDESFTKEENESLNISDTVANNIVEEREKGPFISIEEFQIRCKVSGTLIDKMRLMGIFGDMPETSQLSLF